MKRRLGLLMALVACVPPGNPSSTAQLNQVTAALVGDPTAPVLHVEAELFVFTNGETEGYLDGATLTVNERGKPVTIGAPVLGAQGFPVRSNDGAGRLVFDLPSPFTDFQTFDAHCSARSRTVDVTALVYVPENDFDPDQPPPLLTATASAPIRPTGSPPGDALFGARLVVSSASGSAEAPRPPQLVAWGGGVAFALAEYGQSSSNNNGVGGDEYVNGSTPEFGVRVIDTGGVTEIYQLPDLAEAPRLAAGAGALYYAGRARDQVAVEVGELFKPAGGLWSTRLFADYVSDDAGAPLASAISAHAAGLRVAVRSSRTLLGLNDAELVPDPSKYFGAFLYELDLDGQITSAEVLPDDVIAMIDLPDGRRATATAELPPRTRPAMLHVAMLDALGNVTFSHDEPAFTYDATLVPYPDGGLLIATEDREVTDRVVLLRLAADGSVLFNLRALGRDGSVAVRDDGAIYWAFTGQLSGLPAALEGAAPERPVPLLLEIAGSGSVSRVSQLGCGGWSIVGTSTTDVFLTASLAEWAAFGPVRSDRSQLLAFEID